MKPWSAAFASALLISTAALALEPAMTLTVESPSKPIVHGTTNLPDGAELIVTISRAQSRYSAQSKAVVQGGQFVSEQFSQDGGDLNPGTYAVEVTMGTLILSPSVESIVGANGENLTGKLVKRTEFGRLLTYTSTFKVGMASNPGKDAAARVRSKTDMQRWAVDACNYNIDLVNSMVRAGKVSGHEYVGAEREQKVADCIKGTLGGNK